MDGYVLIPRADFTPEKKQLEFPEKLMKKVLDKAIPLFVAACPNLSDDTKRVFLAS